MSGSTILGFGTLLVAVAGAIYPFLQWKQRRADRREERAEKSLEKATEEDRLAAAAQQAAEVKLRDSMGEWYDRMSRTNRDLLTRVEDLEKKRELDRRQIDGLIRYIHQLIEANPNMTIPPAPADLGL